MTISAASPGRCFLLRWLHAAEIGVQVKTALEGWELLGGGTAGPPGGTGAVWWSLQCKEQQGWGCLVLSKPSRARGSWPRNSFLHLCVF